MSVHLHRTTRSRVPEDGVCMLPSSWVRQTYLNAFSFTSKDVSAALSIFLLLLVLLSSSSSSSFSFFFWHCSPLKVHKASSKIVFHCSLSYYLRLQFLLPIFSRSSLTGPNHKTRVSYTPSAFWLKKSKLSARIQFLNSALSVRNTERIQASWLTNSMVQSSWEAIRSSASQ